MSVSTTRRSPAMRSLAVLLAACLLLSTACAVNPGTGEEELVLMSEAQELAMGARYYPKTTQLNYGLPPDDPGLQAYVKRIGHYLARHSHRPNIPWDFNVVNSNQVNAFALPGGKISLTRALLTHLQSEDEMASVLGHEIGHVAARHTVAQYTRLVLVQLAIAGVALALSDTEFRHIGPLAAGVAGVLLLLSYSRDQERQADQLGYEYMVRCGYNPTGQVRTFEMFQRLRKSEPGFLALLLSSHPLTRERIQASRRRVMMTNPRLVNQALRVTPYRRALARQLERAPAYNLAAKGDKAYDRGRYREAADYYQQAIRRYSRDGVLYARRALALVKYGEPRQARAPAQRGVELSPGVFLPNHVAGLVYFKLGNLSQAERYLLRADQLLPDHELNKFLLGATYERMGRRYQAIRIYRELVRQSPSSPAGKKAKERLKVLGAG